MTAQAEKPMNFRELTDERLHMVYQLNLIWTNGPGNMAMPPLNPSDREYLISQLEQLYANGGPQDPPKLVAVEVTPKVSQMKMMSITFTLWPLKHWFLWGKRFEHGGVNASLVGYTYGPISIWYLKPHPGCQCHAFSDTCDWCLDQGG